MTIEKEEKTPVQLQREAIDVTVSSKTGDEDETSKPEEVVEGKEEVVEEVKETIDENKEAIKDSEKTEEELKAEKEAANTANEKARIQKRIDKEVAKRKAVEAENADLKRKLAAKPDDEKVLTEDDVERLSEEKANQKAINRQFVNDCNTLADAAGEIDKDFDKKIEVMKEEIGPIPGVLIGVLTDVDNGGEVLAYLVNNLDEMEDINALSPTKMGLKIGKLSDRLAAEKKEKEKKGKIKEISKVPEPPNALGGKEPTNNASTTLTGKEEMPDFIRKRNAQIEQRRKEKAAGYR